MHSLARYSISCFLRKNSIPAAQSPYRCRVGFRSIQTWSDVSPREFASLEDDLSRRVGLKVVDPILKKDLRSLNWLDRHIDISQGGKALKLTIRLPSLLHPSKDDLQQATEDIAVEELQDLIQKYDYQKEAVVDIEIVASRPIPAMAKYAENHEELVSQLGPGLVNISQFLAVYSCKGGVGKSTVAVNLAYELARMGARVGLLDIDIYGPSLPILVNPSDPAVRPSPLGRGMVYPITHEGVKLLSLGYVSAKSGVPGSGPNAGAAVMRGPMAARVVNQLLKATDWGDLDLLILDLPPGTGDVQLAVGQELQLSGAVAVTTPSKLAIEDTRKGIAMFTSLGVPTLSIVENLSYFVCEGGTKHYPFGRGLSELLQLSPINHTNFSGSKIIQLPISSVANNATDSGNPICLARPLEAKEELSAFSKLARDVSGELFHLQFAEPENAEKVSIDGVTFDIDTLTCSLAGNDSFVVRLYSDCGARQVRVPAADLRNRDPKTGSWLRGKKPAMISGDGGASSADNVVLVHKTKQAARNPRETPTKVEKKGRYGFAIDWDDGATIIYANTTIAHAAKDVVVS